MTEPEKNSAAGPATETGGAPCSAGKENPRDPSAGDLRQTEAPSVEGLEKLPSELIEFLESQSAQVVNFRRAAQIEIVEGYPRTVGGYKWTAKGDLTQFGRAELPDDATKDKIEAALKEADFPKIDSLLAIPEPPPGVNLSDPLTFICHDLKGKVAMIHQRYEKRDGGKGFIPWTRWSDGLWRKMEPDVLPFFGTPGGQDKSTLFIHEGAKAAMRMKRLIEGDLPSDDFPWFEEMRYGHHVGWIGGIWALERSDWAGLAGMGWSRVILVADNEGGGIRAAALASKHFRCPTFLLRFGGAYPPRFDCGDELPANMRDNHGRYIGPSFSDCLQPYDWATDLVPRPDRAGRMRDVPVPRDQFKSQHVIVAETEQAFSRSQPAIPMRRKPFNDSVRPRSDAVDTYALLVKEPECVCDYRTFAPNQPPGQISESGRIAWNAFQPSDVSPFSGDPGPFLSYLNHLFPIDGERFAVMRWLATLIARRDIRMHYSLLLISKRQGVGKSTLGKILEAQLGERNVSFPGQSAFESQFNDWCDGKLLVFVNEIYTNGNAKIYDQLKNFITDDEITINAKHIAPYRLKNWAVIVACSNSRKALFLPDEDRRWLVPTVTEELRERSEWVEFHEWLDGGGQAIIAHWAEEFARENAVQRGERPPVTAAKRAIINESKSEGRLLARDFGEEFADMDPAIVRVSDLREWIAARRGLDLASSTLEKERLLIDELEGVEGLSVWKGDARPRIGGKRGSKSSVVFNFPIPGGARWAEMEDRLTWLKELGFSGEEGRPL